MGNAVHLGERECSIQRRHQKLIEESPSPAVDEDLRQKLGAAAVKLARTSQYTGAGTMEFLLDATGGYYFLEMNTRLQVEHPVTEEISGIDLVKEQIQVAEGLPLSIRQDQVKLSGHALECRICAENPADGFMPSTGMITRYEIPEGRIRVENGFRQDDEISVYYDSLLAKVISWGNTRPESIAAMKRALKDFKIQGVKTTIPFSLLVLDHEKFIAGEIDTRFVDKYFDPLRLQKEIKEHVTGAAVAAVLLSIRGDGKEGTAVRSGLATSRWKDGRRGALR